MKSLNLLFLALFISSSTSYIINCRFILSGWTVIGVVGTCDVTSIRPTGNSTHIVGFEGDITPSSIQRLQFQCGFNHYDIPVVPRGILNFFPNVIGIDFHGCTINHLTGHELDEYPQLDWFSITDVPSLRRLPGNLFDPTPNIRHINFRFNGINFVGEGLLDHLPRLRWAYFLRNQCIDKMAQTPEEIAELIQELRENCSDSDFETTTLLPNTTTLPSNATTLFPSTTNNPGTCDIGNIEDFVCTLDDELQELRSEVRDLNLWKDVAEKRLDELERIVIELWLRP